MRDSDGGLALEIWVLIDGGGDCALLEMRDHLLEQVCGDQADFSGALSFLDGADYRHAVDGAYVDGLEFGFFVQQRFGFSVALFFGFVGFEDCDYFSRLDSRIRSRRGNLRLWRGVLRCSACLLLRRLAIRLAGILRSARRLVCRLNMDRLLPCWSGCFVGRLWS